MAYCERIEIKSYDVDMNGVMRPTSLLAKLEELGANQMEKFPPSNSDLRKEGKGFILSRVVMSISREINEGEEAYGETWACDNSRGLSFVRCYKMTVNGESVAEIYSVWALSDFKENKLKRVEECGEIGGKAEPAAENPLPLRVRMPKAEELVKVGVRQVYYSDIDLNRHMNNTKYLNMLCDYIPGIESKQICGINISYITEAPFGEELSVWLKEDNGVFYFKTVRKDSKTNCEAVIYTEARKL